MTENKPKRGRPLGSRGWRYYAQVECERRMASSEEYSGGCMCGAQGPLHDGMGGYGHDLLSEEAVKEIWDEEYSKRNDDG